MGGKAAEGLIKTKLSQHPANQGLELYYRPISNTELDQILPLEYGKHIPGDNSVVGTILNQLIDANMIDPSYFPKFVLGSTRLAAVSKYGAENIEIDDFETDEIIQNALSKKTSFGDLDIDVKMTKSGREIADFLNQMNPEALAARLGAGEVHIAIKMDDDSVLQMDLLGISGDDPSREKFMQYSSFLDLSHDIKGVFATMLLRAVASAKQPQNLGYFEEFLEANPDTDFAQKWSKITNSGYKPIMTRYIVSPDHLKLAVEFQKEGVKTIKKLFYPEFRKEYNDIESLAKFLLGDDAKGPELLHARALAAYVRDNFTKEQIELIKERFLVSLSRSVEGSMPKEALETGKNAVLDILSKPEPKIVKEGRKGIGRFIGPAKMTNKAALEVIYSLIHQSNNVGKEHFTINLLEDPNKIDLVEKMDSNFIGIGLDKRGKFFIESSNSGLVYPSTYKQKFSFSEDFLRSYESLMTNEGLQQSLKQIHERVGAFKLNTELFPMMTHEGTEDGRVVFVGTPYLKDKFGSEGGLTVFKAQLWNNNSNRWYYPDQETNSKIVRTFKRLAEANGFENEWKVYSNDEDMVLPGHLELNMRGLSRFFADRESLEELKKLVRKADHKRPFNDLKESLQQQLDDLANNSKSNLGGEGSYIEGVVLRIKENDGEIIEIKGTSKEFDEKKKKYWYSRAELLNLEKSLKKSVFLNILGFPTDHPASVKKNISTFVYGNNNTGDEDDELDDGEDDKTNGYIKSDIINKTDLILNLLKAGIIFSGENADISDIKGALASLIQSTFAKLDEIKNDVDDQRRERTIDKDSLRKTYEIFNSVHARLEKYKQILDIQDDREFFVQFVSFALERVLSKIINLDDFESYQKDAEEYEKVIVIPGRFQPFHKGHKNMVEMAVEALPEVGGDKVLIYVIKGSDSSLDNEENPLNEKEQIELMTSLYRNNPKVEVATDVLPNAHFATSVVPSLYDKNLKFVGIAAGKDRMPQYRQFVYSFNPSIFKADHDFTPIDKKENGHYNFKFVTTPRDYSGTEARELPKTTDFDTFINTIMDSDISEETREMYRKIYYKLGGGQQEPEETEQLGEAQYDLGVFLRLIEEARWPEPEEMPKFISRFENGFEEAKKEFIEINIIRKKKQIKKLFLSKPPDTRAEQIARETGRDIFELVFKSIVDFVKKTSFEIYPDDPGCQNLGGEHYRACYNPVGNKIKYGRLNRELKQNNVDIYKTASKARDTLFHELGHAKDFALATYITGVVPNPKEIYKRSFGGLVGAGTELYSRSEIYKDIKECFPGLDPYTATEHHEHVYEFYASLQTIFMTLGRSYLTEQDIQLVCDHRKAGVKYVGRGKTEARDYINTLLEIGFFTRLPSSVSSGRGPGWKKKSKRRAAEEAEQMARLPKSHRHKWHGPSAGRYVRDLVASPAEKWVKTLNLPKSTMTVWHDRIHDSSHVAWPDKNIQTVLREYLSNEVWSTFDCSKCPPKKVAQKLNDLAKLNIKGPESQQQMVAESFLQMIEEVINESNNDGSMFGVGRSYLSQNIGVYRKVAPDTDIEPRASLNNDPADEVEEESFSLNDLASEIKNVVSTILKDKQEKGELELAGKEEELEEISAMGSSAVGGFAGNAYGPAGLQRRKPKKETKKVEETTNKLLNYLLQIAGEK